MDGRVGMPLARFYRRYRRLCSSWEGKRAQYITSLPTKKDPRFGRQNQNDIHDQLVLLDHNTPWTAIFPVCDVHAHHSSTQHIDVAPLTATTASPIGRPRPSTVSRHTRRATIDIRVIPYAVRGEIHFESRIF